MFYYFTKNLYYIINKCCLSEFIFYKYYMYKKYELYLCFNLYTYMCYNIYDYVYE